MDDEENQNFIKKLIFSNYNVIYYIFYKNQSNKLIVILFEIIEGFQILSFSINRPVNYFINNIIII
jgi:hypothetical protein